MGAILGKLDARFASTKAIFPILISSFLLITYCLVASPAFAWIGGEVEQGVIITACAFSVICLSAAVWKFGAPVTPLSFFAICLIALCGWLSNLSFSILQQLSASFALLGAYGFFASFSRVSPSLWRKGLVMAGLTALALPFALVPGTGMGFYLRLLTADAAAQLLAVFGHASLEAHDVLIFDNGIAQVDLPCSGLKSLFTGTGFFFAASLLLRREVNFKWMSAYVIFALLLIIANTIRVTILIWVSEILQYRGIAETIHMPLGLMLFCIVCLCGVYMLIKLKPFKVEASGDISPEKKPNLPKINFQSGLLGIFVGVAFIAMSGFSAKPHFNAQGQVSSPNLLMVQEVGLTSTETRFFGARDRTSAGKWTFEYQDFSGSMLVVRSGAANGLHAPEVCMLGNGISVDDMQTRAFNAGKYRYLTVDDGRRNAVYWMQSQRIITDDFRARLSNFIFGGQDDWIMVTILFDDRLNLAESETNKASLESLMLKLQSHYGAEISRKQVTDEPR